MAQTAFTVRMDADVKKRFDELCKDFGMSSNTAFNMFARAVIKSERIPFDVESEERALIERARPGDRTDQSASRLERDGRYDLGRNQRRNPQGARGKTLEKRDGKGVAVIPCGGRCTPAS